LSLNLPSLDDIIFILFLIIPGYISLKIVIKISGIKREISEYDLLFSSIIISGIIYSITGIILNKLNYDELKSTIIQPVGIAYILSVTFFIGIIFGLTFYGWRIINNYVPNDSWTSVIEKYDKKYDDPWVIIYTKDGKEYKGIINYFAIEKEKKSLTISTPKIIFRDDNFVLIDELLLGDEMYFSNKDILRILFLHNNNMIENMGIIERLKNKMIKKEISRIRELEMQIKELQRQNCNKE